MQFLFYLFFFLEFAFTTLACRSFFHEQCEEYKKKFINSSHRWNDESKIAHIGDFPHIVALGYPEEGKYTFRCGGTLISNKFILLPAHCAESLDQVQPKLARMGVVEFPAKVHTFNSQTDHYIKKLTVHFGYNRRKRSDNIALAELEKKITFTDDVRPACLYSNYNTLGVNGQNITSRLILTEWNENIRNPNMTTYLSLYKNTASYVPIQECSLHYTIKYNKSIAAGQICATSRNNDTTCEGPIGGPLQLYNGKLFTVVGVPSHGGMCGSTIPTVYTLVEDYLNWIKSVAWNYKKNI